MVTQIVCRSGIATMAAVLALSACTTLDPYTREEQTARAQRNAVIGAVSGAVAGLITGDSSMERKKRALVGAGLGALAGGAVGSYMDRQEARLRAELDRTGVSVTRVGDNITLNMPGNITFATNSADLNAGFYDVLNSVALVVNEFNQTVIEVAGHTDSTGTDTYNQQLSERRPRRLPRTSSRGTCYATESSRSAWASRVRSRPTTRTRAGRPTAASSSRSCRSR